MRRVRAGVTTAILIALTATTATAKVMVASEESAVRKTVEAYGAAIVGKDGAAAVALVDKASLRYYDSLRKAALTADKATLAKRSMVDRISVLRLRAELSPKKLRAMKGAEVFRYTVEQGWTVRLAKGKSEIRAVEIKGARATAEVAAGRMGDMTWTLNKEGKTWRVNVQSMLPGAEKMLAMFHKRSGKAEDEFVLAALAMVTGKPAPATLWDVPR